MTVEKPKPKKLQSQSPVQTNYHFQPTMNPWNSWSNLLNVNFFWSKSEIIQARYFENEMVWNKPKPIPIPQ